MSEELVYYDEFQGEHELDRMLELIEADLSEPYSVYTYRFFLHNWPKLCINCKDKATNQIIGTIIGKVQRHKKGSLRGYIGMLAVDCKWRGKGIGTRLVLNLLQEMKRTQADEIVLETEISNVNALKLYEGLGFFKDKLLSFPSNFLYLQSNFLGSLHK